MTIKVPNSKVVMKDWGHEEILYNTNLYCSKILVINPGCETSMHYHSKKHETLTVSSGAAIVKALGDFTTSEYHLETFDSLIIPPNHKHKIINNSSSKKLVIFEASTKDDPQDSTRV